MLSPAPSPPRLDELDARDLERDLRTDELPELELDDDDEDVEADEPGRDSSLSMALERTAELGGRYVNKHM